LNQHYQRNRIDVKISLSDSIGYSMKALVGQSGFWGKEPLRMADPNHNIISK